MLELKIQLFDKRTISFYIKNNKNIKNTLSKLISIPANKANLKNAI